MQTVLRKWQAFAIPECNATDQGMVFEMTYQQNERIWARAPREEQRQVVVNERESMLEDIRMDVELR